MDPTFLVRLRLHRFTQRPIIPKFLRSENGSPPMKRVLHVLYSLERSGMEMMLLNSNSEWRDRGYECDVLATADSVGPLAGQMRACGYSVHHLPFRGWPSLLPRLDF